MISLILRRKKNNGDTTIGWLTDQNQFIKLDTLEDEPRKVKVKGETRIPSGSYEIKPRMALSPLTKRYRERFTWFKWHLELQDVPGFKYVYIHIGNDDDDTDGCILVGYKTGDFKIWQSTKAYRDLYYYLMGAINSGSQVFINILDEDE